MYSYNYEGYGQCDIGAPDFRAVAKVGTEAPNFSLTVSLPMPPSISQQSSSW